MNQSSVVVPITGNAPDPMPPVIITPSGVRVCLGYNIADQRGDSADSDDTGFAGESREQLISRDYAFCSGADDSERALYATRFVRNARSESHWDCNSHIPRSHRRRSDTGDSYCQRRECRNYDGHGER